MIRLEEILEEIIAEGDKVLCFTQFTEFAEMLLPHLAARFGTDIAYLHGGTPKSRRDELVTRFQTDDGPPVFLLSPQVLTATGLNLTAASHVVHLDRWWNPAVENQATDRAFRIGQTRNVQVRKFICTGTLEEKIDEMIEDKRALADLVITDGEGLAPPSCPLTTSGRSSSCQETLSVMLLLVPAALLARGPSRTA